MVFPKASASLSFLKPAVLLKALLLSQLVLTASSQTTRPQHSPCRLDLQTEATTNVRVWPGGRVPYGFERDVSVQNQERTHAAMREIERVCEVRFVPWKSERDHLIIQNADTNYSDSIGVKGGRQLIGMKSWEFRFVIVHELLHALGFHHEHQRPDRDRFIEFHHRCKPSKTEAFQYEIQHAARTLTDYDFESVMHYPATHRDLCTEMRARPPFQRWQASIGQRHRLSDGDIHGLRCLYGNGSRSVPVRVGRDGDGAGVAVTRLDADPRPELIFMAYDDPEGGNSFRYVIGWNVDANGRTTRWTQAPEVGGVGNDGAGAGIVVGHLDANPRPDLILMAYDDPVGGNSFRYRVGLNLDTNGIATSWSKVHVVGGVGNEGAGAGLALANLDSNPYPELVVMAYDDPEGGNSFRYRIGWNVRENGVATSWSDVRGVAGVGNEADGAGATFAQLDGDARPELVFLAYDRPAGRNTLRYRIGWNVGANGNATHWTDDEECGFGDFGDGAGVAVGHLDGNSCPDLILMAYDAPEGPNEFRYNVFPDVGQRCNARPRLVQPTGSEASLPNVVAGQDPWGGSLVGYFRLRGANLSTVNEVRFGPKLRTLGRDWTKWAEGYFVRRNAGEVLVSPPQGQRPGIYDVAVRTSSGWSNPVTVTLRRTARPTLGAASRVFKTRGTHALIATHGMLSDQTIVQLAFSPSNRPTVVPGVVSLAIGNMGTSLFFYPAQWIRPFSQSTKWDVVISAPMVGRKIYYQAFMADLRGALFPLNVTDVRSLYYGGY